TWSSAPGTARASACAPARRSRRPPTSRCAPTRRASSTASSKSKSKSTRSEPRRAAVSDLLRLTLVRHAEAEAAPFGTEDRVRALTRRGRHEAHAMSRRLRARHTPPDKLLSSPAERAWMTAVIFGRELGVAPADIERDERLYLASAARLLEVIRSA